jgi:hypothetical protein
MSEAKQLRPRLTKREIQFLIDSLKHTLKIVSQREQEYKELKSKVYRLKLEVRKGNTRIWRELKEAKEGLKGMGNVESIVFHYRSVCNRLIRRLEALLNGGKLHTGLWTEYSLSQIYLEPKNLEKTQSL